MIDFPANPSVGNTFSSGGYTWRWDGTRWVSTGVTPTIANHNKFINGFLLLDQQYEGNGAAIPAGNLIFGADGVKCGVNTTRFTSGTAQRIAAGSTVPFPYAVAATYTMTAGGPASATDWMQIFDLALEGNVMADTGWPNASALPLTISFYFASDTAGTYSLGFRGAGGTPYRTYMIDFVVPGDSLYHLYTFTIPPDTNSAWTPLPQIEIDISAGAGSTYVAPSASTWLTGNYVQGPGNTNPGYGAGTHHWWLGAHKLEVGTQATPMAMTAFSDTLMRCQRYYEKSHAIGTRPGTNVSNSAQCWLAFTPNGGGGRTWEYKVPKRAAPTMTFFDGVGTQGMWSYYTTAGGWVNSWPSTSYVFQAAYTNGFITNMAAGSSAMYYQFDYTADARI